MTAPRARIIRATSSKETRGETLFSLRPSAPQRRRIAREEIEARLAGERIVQEARSQAEAILAQAHDRATSAAEQVVREAHEQAQAEALAEWLAWKQAEGVGLVRDTERVIAIAAVLAERLLGAALEFEPARIADLARTAIAEARAARRVTIEAHALDAEALRQHLQTAGLEPQTVEIRENETLARGELRLQTELGTIDAKLAPRLERLAAALRDALP
jgi:flagellar biosynthesis/type III secretory pathway protein FliH